MTRRTALLAVPLLAAALLSTAAPAEAARRPAHRPTAAVSLGDSYMSGVGGRWRGNSADATGSRQGTDRAYVAATGTYDPAIVYGSTADGCMRSDVAEIRSAQLPVQRSINIACSGATTANILRASAGGQGQYGELPQDDQLAVLARQDDVRLITLSIGGNDLGFSSVVGGCVLAYLFRAAPCGTSQQPVIAAKLPQLAAAVGRAIDDIRATMRAAGYRPGSYRLIVQSYPAPSPAAGNRYPEAGSQRAAIGGCPFYDADDAWSHDWLVPAIAAALGGAARAHGAQFLDLTDAFAGHQLCATTDEQSDGTPASAEDEWVRFVDLAKAQGPNESIHPDAFGQQALGRCLDWAVLLGHDLACHALPHLPASVVYPTFVR